MEIENVNLTETEISQIVEDTIQKIENYPKWLGKTVENYFDILFENEVGDYIMRRGINRLGRENFERKRALCAVN